MTTAPKCPMTPNIPADARIPIFGYTISNGLMIPSRTTTFNGHTWVNHSGNFNAQYLVK